MMHRPAAPRSSYVAIVDATVCDECGLCMPLCPTGAITMHRSGLAIDAVGCTGCEKCIDPCPVAALDMVPDRATQGQARRSEPTRSVDQNL